jgi:hypothetical protein
VSKKVKYGRLPVLMAVNMNNIVVPDVTSCSLAAFYSLDVFIDGKGGRSTFLLNIGKLGHAVA